MCEDQELFFKCILLVADHMDSEGHTVHLHSIAEYGPMYQRGFINASPIIIHKFEKIRCTLKY